MLATYVYHIFRNPLILSLAFFVIGTMELTKYGFASVARTALFATCCQSALSICYLPIFTVLVERVNMMDEYYRYLIF
jgi:hypothetical protein